MYKLYAAYGTMSLPVHITLEALMVPYEIIFLNLENGEQKLPEYLKVNPNGRIPALVLEDGQVIYESSAILLTLADSHPESGLSPRLDDPKRPQFLQWMFFLTNSLQATMLNSKYPYRLVEDVSEEILTVVSQGAFQCVNKYMEVIDQHLAQNGPYFMGEQVTIADFHFALSCRALRDSAKPPRSYAHITTLLNKLNALPYVKIAYQQEHLEGPLA